MDREAMVKDMCEYLLKFDRSSTSNDGGDTDWGSMQAAIDIAHDLYGENDSEDHPDA